MNKRRLSILTILAAGFCVLLLLFAVVEWKNRSGGRVEQRGGEAPPLPTRDLVPVAADQVERTRPRVAEEPPAAAADRESEIPAVFFGDVSMEGTVLDGSGRPVPDLTLGCHPALFASGELSRRKVHRTRTDAEGRFTFHRLPRVYHYELRALDKGRFGAKGIWREPSETRLRITLYVNTVLYARIACVDESGVAVDTAGATVAEANRFDNRLVWTSTAPRTRTKFTDLDPFSGADPALERHTITICFWADTADRPMVMSLLVPNHATAVVRLKGRPLAEWPAATRVVLRVKPLPGDKALYRIAFPRSDGRPPPLTPTPCEIQTLM